jgi:hypothetical protein
MDSAIFLGVINVGEAHSLAPCGDKTPIFTKCNDFFLKALRCITGTGYGLARLAMAPGTKSMWIFCGDRHPMFHQIVWCAPLKPFLGLPSAQCSSDWLVDYLINVNFFIFGI